MRKSTLSEGDFQNTVIELAEWHKWRIYHVAKVKGQLRSETSKGFPDLVFARPGRLVFAELKLEGEEPTANQLIWHALLRAVGEEMYVWRPYRLARDRRGAAVTPRPGSSCTFVVRFVAIS